MIFFSKRDYFYLTSVCYRYLNELDKAIKGLDNLIQIESAEEFVPKIYRFHFTGCELVQRLLPKSLAATHNPKSWKEVEYLCKKLLI